MEQKTNSTPQKPLPDLIGIQNSLLPRIKLQDRFPLEKLRTVAGVDLPYWEEAETTRGVCALVVINYQTKQVVERVHAAGKIQFPYKSGCLAFREPPLILQTSKNSKNLHTLIFSMVMAIFNPVIRVLPPNNLSPCPLRLY